LNTYFRNGKIAGLQGEKRRYRLKTLGFSKERLEELNRRKIKEVTKSRIQLLQKINKDNERDKGLER